MGGTARPAPGRGHRPAAITGGLTLLLGLCLLGSLCLGENLLSPAAVLRTLLGGGEAGAGEARQRILSLTILSIRLPRALLALLVGSALAVSGAILQRVTHNDLADPGILGISSGAALFVVVYIFLTNGGTYYALPALTLVTLPAAALAGGLLAAALVYALARRRGGVSRERLLLMGIAVNAGCTACVTAVQVSFNVKDFNRVLAWTLGSIWGAGMGQVRVLAPVLLVLLAVALYQSRYIELFVLGDEMVVCLGEDVEKRRRFLMAIAAMLAAVATAAAGSVSFVGLMAPHLARRLVGARQFPGSVTAALCGMILTLAADTLARAAFAPVELHLGTVIALLGAPYFIYLLLKE